MKVKDGHIELPLFTMNEVENNRKRVSMPQRNTTIVIDYSLKSSINLTDSRLSEIIREYRNKKAQSRKIARENRLQPKRSPSVKFKKKAGEKQNIEIRNRGQPSTFHIKQNDGRSNGRVIEEIEQEVVSQNNYC